MAKKEIKPYLLEQSETLVDLIEALDDAVEKNNEDASKTIVEQLNKMGNELVELVINLEGDDKAYAHFMLGSLCSSLRMWPEAEDSYKQTLAVWPDHVGVLNELFVAQYEMQKYAHALESVTKSIEIGGETPDIIHNLAATQWQLGKQAEAKLTLIGALSKYPTDENIQSLLSDMENAEL